MKNSAQITVLWPHFACTDLCPKNMDVYIYMGHPQTTWTVKGGSKKSVKKLISYMKSVLVWEGGGQEIPI